MHRTMKAFQHLSALRTAFLFCLWLVAGVSLPALAGVEVTNDRTYLNGVASPGVSVEDSKYTYMRLYSTWPDSLLDRHMVNRVSLGIDPTRINASDPNLSYSVTVRIQASKWNGSAFVNETYTDVQLNVTYNTSGEYQNQDYFLFTGAYAFNVEVTASSGTLMDAIYLEGESNVERYYAYDLNTIPEGGDLYQTLEDNNLTLYWPYARGAEAYDLEWTYIDTVNRSAQSLSSLSYDFSEDAMRVRVSDNQFTLPLLLNPGIVLFRYRPVYFDSTTYEPTVEGAWSTEQSGLGSRGSVSTFINHATSSGSAGPNQAWHAITERFDPLRNWSATSVFTEEGKAMHAVSYADGLGRVRQSQVSNPDIEQVIASSSIYDAEGRPAVSVLPAPVDRYSFAYIDSLNLSADSAKPFSWLKFELDQQFDTNNCRYNYVRLDDANSTGAAHYYSDKNTDQDGAQAFVPDADSVPFMITRYMPDNTGRIYSMGGGFGNEFQPLDGREIQFRYDQVTNADLAAYFELDDRGESQYYKRKHVIDQNNQRSVIYQDANDRVILSTLAGSAPANLTPLDGSSVNDPRVADLTEFNATEDGTITLSYQQFVRPNQAYILGYEVTVPEYVESCDPAINLCFDCVYDVDVHVTYEDECYPSKRITAYRETHTLGQFTAAVNACSGDTSFLLASDGDTSLAFPYNTVLYVTKTLSLNTDAAQSYADYYVDESGCVPSLEDLFRDVFRDLAPQLDSCEADPCYASCYSEIGSFTEFFWDSVVALGRDPIPTIDTSAMQTHYDSLIQECAQFCNRGLNVGKTRCEELEERLIAQFVPGNLYATYTASFTGANAHSVFTSGNVFNVNYQDTTIDYRQADGSPYPDKATGPWGFSVQNFILGFQQQWAEAIYAHIKAADNLPDEAQCLMDICDTSVAEYRYEAILRSIQTYEQALLVRHAPNDSGFFLNPVNWAGAPTHYTTPGCCMGNAQTDPLTSHPVIGPLLTSYVQDPLGANGTENLYQLAHRLVRNSQGTSPYKMGTDTCYMDREWRLFRNMYLGERDRLLDSLVRTCTADTIPFDLGHLMTGVDADPNLDSALNNFNPNDMAGDYQLTIASQCDSSCLELASSWINQLDSCVSDTAILQAMMADFVALCQASCSPANPFGATSLPAQQDIIYAGALGNQPIDTIPTSIAITVNGSGPFNVSSFADIMDTYDAQYTGFTQSLYCNPYRIESLSPHRDSIAYPQLDVCACDKVEAVAHTFDSLQNANALPAGINTKADLFYRNYGVWLYSFAEADCACGEAAASADEAAYLANLAIPVPQGVSCETCYTCSQLTTHYNAMLSSLNVLSGNDTSDQVFELFRVYLLNNQTGIDLSSGDLSVYIRDCQEFDATGLVRQGLSPHAENLLTWLNLEFDRNAWATGSYNLPLYHAYYRSSLYPHAFDTLADVEYSLSGSFGTSLAFSFSSNVVALPVSGSITLTSVSPASVTLDSLWAITGIAARASTTASGDVFQFQLEGSTINGTAFTILGTSTFPLFATMTNSGGAPQPQMCPNRYSTIKAADPCADLLVEQALSTVANQLMVNVDSIRNAFLANYEAQCSAVQETAAMEYDANEYTSTLYYYTADGNLVQTIAPKGVVQGTPANHSFRTKYHYDSWNQLIASESPDGGKTRYWYNNSGQLVLSQNADQRADSTQYEGQWYYPMSYTQYDSLGRIAEVGEIYARFRAGSTVFGLPENTPDTLLYQVMLESSFPAANTFVAVSSGSYLAWEIYRKQDVTRTYYTEPLSAETEAYFGWDGQEHLQRRVASVTYEERFTSDSMDYDYGLHFSYDIHGNVRTLVMEDALLRNFDLHLKRIDYDYELLSGNVREVAYQQHQADARFHRYAYDANNRLEGVYTSTDHVVWEEDATYAYYHHGPLARTEIGTEKVQGLDYVYNLQGWIKAMNSNTLVTDRDPGKDGDRGADYLGNVPQVHANVAKDVFGYVLGYYEGDYKAIDGSKQTFASTLGGDFDYSANLKALYNGNISYQVSAITNLTTELIQPYGKAYAYDQLNRLKTQTIHNLAAPNALVNTNSWSGSFSQTDYSTVHSYDANGNLTDLDRNALISPHPMDRLEYTYTSGTNQLERVTETLTEIGSSPTDLDIENGSYDFTYNAIGQLTSSTLDEIGNIEWNVYGKVKSITRNGINDLPDLEFRYDPFGNRIAKIEKPRSAGVADSSQYWRYTFYANDASGMPHAVYEATPNGQVFDILEASNGPTAQENITLSYELTDQNLLPLQGSGAFSLPFQQVSVMPSLTTLLNQQALLSATHLSGTITLTRSDGLEWISPTLEICIDNGDEVSCYLLSLTRVGSQQFTYDLAEQPIYGSSRLGLDTDPVPLARTTLGAHDTYGFDSLEYVTLTQQRQAVVSSEFILSMEGTQVNQNPQILLQANGNSLHPYTTGNTITLTGTARQVFDTLVNRIGRNPDYDTLHIPGNDSMIRVIPKTEADIPPAYALAYVPQSGFRLRMEPVQAFDMERFGQGLNTAGATHYELSNHLGNVQNTVSSRRLSQREVVFQEEVDAGTLSNQDYTSSKMSYNASTGVIESSGPGAYFQTNGNFLSLGATAAGFAYTFTFDLDVSGTTVFRIFDSGGGVITTETYIDVSGPQSVTVTVPTNQVGFRWELTSGSFSVDNIEIETGTPLWLAEVKSYMDYYPYGMLMPGRFGFASDGAYRYGFNGMEQDPEANAQWGQKYTTYFRKYDPRLGRWFSVDPVTHPWQSTYSAMDNNPILYSDPRGDKIKWGSVKRYIKTHVKAAFDRSYRKKLKAFKKHWNEKDDKGRDKRILAFDPDLDKGAITPDKYSYRNSKKTPRGDRSFARIDEEKDQKNRSGEEEPPLHMEPKNANIEVDHIERKIIGQPSFPFSPNDLLLDRPIPADNPLIPAPGQPLSISRIVAFQPQSNTLANPGNAQSQLRNIADVLIANPNLGILVLGNVNYARSNGNVTFNGEEVPAPVLMNARGSAIQELLIGMGVPPGQIRFGPGRVLNSSTPTASFVIRNRSPR